ncbi:MAG: imidazole glycerol phosphate synthase subunit HisH [Enterobacterales bacterium]
MKIVILNTECSNLLSVSIAIKRIGYNPIISSDPKIIFQADKVLLPGVGTANSAMEVLKKKKLVNIIKKLKQPILGICLGMQLFGSYSCENGHIKTLNIIDVPVIHIKTSNLPLPHVGWNKINICKNSNLFKGINQSDYFYFIHSYIMPICNFTISTTNYGIPFSSTIKYKNFFGVQFHPERSGKSGNLLLKNFLEM